MSVKDAIYDNWGNRANLTEPSHTFDGARVFKVGRYTITVPDDTSEPAKVAHEYRSWGRTENPMPNLSFSDGEMRIPVEDFADLILRRVPAAELAEGLWTDDDVRARFIECMAERWGSDGIPDEDRRSLLNKIQVAIRAKAIDHAVERLNKYEEGLRAQTDHYRWRAKEHGIYNGLYERYKITLWEMREGGLLDDMQVEQRLKQFFTPEKLKELAGEIADPIMRESVGPQWHESRDYWRAKLEEAFPAPVAEGSDHE